MAAVALRYFAQIVTLAVMNASTTHAGVYGAPAKASNLPQSECITDFSLFGEAPQRKFPPVLLRSEVVPLRFKVLDSSRLSQVAKVIDLNGQVDPRLKNLPAGNYVYAIDSKRRLVILPRAIDPGPVDINSLSATFIGSHEGIVQMLKAVDGKGPKLIAAGEITIRDDRVRMVSNGAGSYRGFTDHLNYAATEFKAHGLAINERTELRDHSVKPFADPHGLADGQARAVIEAARDPGFAVLQSAFRVILKRVDEKFPGQMDFIRAAIAVKETSRQERLLQAAGMVSS